MIVLINLLQSTEPTCHLEKMKGHMFNIDNGYLEGLCRGFKNGTQLTVAENMF